MALTIQNSLSINAYNPFIYATDAWTNLKSISMDGVDEYVDLGNITMLNNTGTFSVSMWVKCPHSAANATFFSKFNDANNRLDAYRQADEKVRFSVVTSSNYVAFESTTTLGDDVWTHLAFVWDGSLATANKVKIYENGSLMGSTITSVGTVTLTATGSASVGLGGLFYANYYDGEQDEVSFFDYALTSGEVTAIYNSGCPNDLMTLAAAKRPEHYYRMGDDDTYPTINDIGETGGKNGTMTNQESTDIIEATPCWNPYLVDAYQPVVAYSTQQISSTVTNVMRIRRSGDSAESDFSASDLTDGTASSWLGVNNGFVTKWYNQGTGGSTYDMVQTTAVNQPQIASSGTVLTINSIPSIKFNGTQWYFTCANTPFGQVSNSFFAMSSARVTSTIGTVLSLSDTTPQSLRIFQDTRTDKRNFVITNTIPTTGYADMSTVRSAVNTLTLLSNFVDASKGMSAFDNGATGGTDTFTGTFTNDAMQIGRQSTGVTYLDGHISEVIGFATDEIANRTDIETNINDRFSIY